MANLASLAKRGMSTARTINAYASFEQSAFLKPWQYNSRPLGDDDVEIKISHCGICGGDLMALDGGSAPRPFTSTRDHPVSPKAQLKMVHFSVMVVVRIWVWCGTLASIYMPSIAVRRIYRERRVGPTPFVPILSTLANSHVWSMYGFLGRAWFPNFPAFAIGDVASLCYVFVYWRYPEDRRRVSTIIGVVFALLAVPTFYVILGLSGYTGQTREDVGRTHGLCFCDVTVISINVLVLKNLVRVFKQKSAASINVSNLCVGTFYSVGWLTFGQLTSNWIIAGPQVFVRALHFSAWMMYFVFSRRSTVIDLITTDDDHNGLSIEISPPADPDKKEEADSRYPVYEALRSPLASLR